MKFLHKRSGVVLLLVIGVLVLATCAGGAFVYATRMPDPATADLGGLLRWLVTRDLSQEPLQTQEQLLVRLEQELRRGVEIGEARKQLTEVQQQQLLANADLLGQLWFFQQVDRYSELAATARQKFLDEQIDDVQRSGVAKALTSLTSDGTGSATNVWARLYQRVQRWTEQLEPQRKTKADEFLAAVQGNLLLRTLRASFSSRG